MIVRTLPLLLCTLGMFLSFAQAAQAEETTPAPPVASPLEAKAAIELMETAPGFQVELVACEPTVVDPVAIRFDEDGRLWVVEMRDYPNGPAEGQPGLSQIRLLEDVDGDGFYEKGTTFADELLFATGLQPYDGGLFVTVAGALLYLKDTTGDGRADHRRTWFTGFAEMNPQLRVNHPTLALDNQIYLANGLRGGEAKKFDAPDQPGLPLQGRDFRFDPRTEAYETVSGMGQFGLCFDDDGNRFVCSNRNPLKQIVLEERYLSHHDKFAPPAATHDVSPPGESSRVFPINNGWVTSNLHEGQFTAACGVTIYRGDQWPAEYRGDGFTCEPTGSLVHRSPLQPDGATFKTVGGDQPPEFLASRDGWFRPVNLELGPDGALYVVDMYRAVIEHPHWMPEELKDRRDLLLGNEQGRIYRVVAKSDKRRPPAKLSQAATAELVALLAHPNAWQRETAARLLLQRQDPAAVPALLELAQSHDEPLARFHALWALEGQQALTDEALAAALEDASPRVQRQALLIAERRLENTPALRDKVLSLAAGKDPVVRFQAALSGGPLASDSQLPVLLKAASLSGDDPWQQYAVILGAGRELGWQAASQFIASIRQAPQAATPGQLSLAQLWLQTSLADNSPQAADALLHAITGDAGAVPTGTQMVLLTSWLKALDGRQTPAGQAAPFDAAADSGKAIFALARTAASDESRSLAERQQAIELLAFDGPSEPQLLKLATDDSSPAIRIDAIEALARRGSDASWSTLLQGFKSAAPPVRHVLLRGAAARPARRDLLLQAVADGAIRPGEIDLAVANQLRNDRDEKRKERAGKLLTAVTGDRAEALARYRAALELPADPRAGQAVFAKQCATCHRIDGTGFEVGPNIGDTRTKTPEQLLTDIIQPNRAIDANFLAYVVETLDGKVLTGVFAAETGASITLQQPGGKTSIVLRDDIERMQSTGVSLMPDGVENNVSLQQMADLIGYLKNWRYLDGRTPLR
ncbi:PVC-type heme-binding CxxCH protein [Lignipirellula cremea]|uniref:Cytochrome c n=1 Tax=Lignipirellula cremea TaxID=2528010 RepID=A0A518DRX9_9BACT|nr:PVC-type heme-binding CxxCH protein [Lignipirellula cremea]QDU94598.1 Cytochrome c [Lignipirellula cremea]